MAHAASSSTPPATDNTKNVWKETFITLLSGGLAGGVSRTLVSPLERLKILFQTQPDPPKYTGIVQSLRLISKEEGIRGFFRGNGANCMRIIPQSAIQYYSYGQLKPFLENGEGQMTPVRRLVAGAIAGALSQIATYPLDMIRARLTVAPRGTYRGMAHAMTMVVRHEGPLALYKGLAPSLAGIAPYIGFDFAVYDTLKEITFIPKNSDGQPTVAAKLICGSIAGLVGQTVAYPFDLVRRRMQVQGMEVSMPANVNAVGGFVLTPDAPRYNGMIDCFRKTVRMNGFFGLYRGLLPNYLKGVPAVAISFVVFEGTKDSLTKRKPDNRYLSILKPSSDRAVLPVASAAPLLASPSSPSQQQELQPAALASPTPSIDLPATDTSFSPLAQTPQSNEPVNANR